MQKSTRLKIKICIRCIKQRQVYNHKTGFVRFMIYDVNTLLSMINGLRVK